MTHLPMARLDRLPASAPLHASDPPGVLAPLRWLSLMPILWAALISLILTSLLARLFHAEPLAVYRLFVVGTWGSLYGIGQVLFKATPLLFTGLAVALAQRAGLFNVGGEGQIIAGALGTALVGTYLPHGTPALLAIPLCLLAGALVGGLLGGFAGFARARLAAHEVIVTILLNFIVRGLLVGAGTVVYVRASVHTAPILPAAQLPRFSDLPWLAGFAGSAVNAALLLGLFLVLGYHVLLRYTHFGFALRTLGDNRDAAAAAGFPIARLTVLAMALSGALAGLGGANFVLGYKHYFEDGFSAGMGYLGIAVAVLAQGRPLALCAGALLFGTLSQGGLAVNALVPRELIDVLSAVVILVIATTNAEVSRLVKSLGSRALGGSR